MDIVLISLDMTAAPAGRVHRMCTAPFNVTYNGYEYIGIGDIINIDELDLTADLTSIGLSFTLGGIDPAYRREIDNNGFKRAPIEVLLATVADGTNVVPDNTAIFYHRGTCDTPNTSIDHDTGTLVINITTQSMLGNLKKIPDLCRTSQATHTARHPGDDFFKFVATTEQEELWIS
ncbi:TPA: hypothetical protein ACPHTZ_000493 [Vibrio alginolyticus]|nr:hypothetical protein [Vibrio parahaemolyticus]